MWENMERPSPVALAKDDPWQAQQVARELDPANHVDVPLRLGRPHPILIAVVSAVNAVRREAVARDAAHRTKGKPFDPSMNFDGPLLKFIPLGFRVTISSADRAILIIDTLLKACEERGLAPFVGRDGLHIGYGEHSARLRIAERVEKKHGSVKNLSDWDIFLKRNIIYTSTDELTLIVERHSAVRKVADQLDLPLEAQINSAIILVYRAVAETRAWAVYSGERNRQEAECRANQAAALAKQEEHRLEVERRRAELLAEAEAWQKASAIRLYVDNIVTGSLPGSTGAEEWASWALQLADELDPTTRRFKINE